MVPTAVISASAWRVTCEELSRVAPCEGIGVPLVAVRVRGRSSQPWRMLALSRLRQVIIADVLLVPPHLQNNQLMTVAVRPHTDQTINARVLRRLARHPRLRAGGYLHSHPFAEATTRPSGGPGGDYQGHMVPLLATNRAAGLNTSFSFIAHRARGRAGWQLRGFALNGRAEIVDLGPVLVRPDHAPEIRWARRRPGWRSAPARAGLRKWRRDLRQQGFRLTSDQLFGGWLRTIVHLGSRHCVVCLVPLEYPARVPRFFGVDRARRTTTVLSRTTIPFAAPPTGPGAARCGAEVGP